MSELLPDQEAFYTSPFDKDALAAIGRLITCWSVVETAMAMQVARVVAVSFDLERQAWALDVPAFGKAAMAAQGTAIKASITQLQNLLPEHAVEIKPHADRILDIKRYRDECAHNLTTPMNGMIDVLSIGASRRKMVKNVQWTIPQITKWCDRLSQHSIAIDKIVSGAIWFNWSRIEEAQTLWFEARDRLAAQIRDNLHRSGSDPLTKSEGASPVRPSDLQPPWFAVK